MVPPVPPRVSLGSFYDSRRTTVDISSDSRYMIYISTAYTVSVMCTQTQTHACAPRIQMCACGRTRMHSNPGGPARTESHGNTTCNNIKRTQWLVYQMRMFDFGIRSVAGVWRLFQVTGYWYVYIDRDTDECGVHYVVRVSVVQYKLWLASCRPMSNVQCPYVLCRFSVNYNMYSIDTNS